MSKKILLILMMLLAYSAYLQAKIYHIDIEKKIGDSNIFQFAKRGNPVAQYDLAWRYKKGIGVPRNLRKAFNLFHSSALKNYAPAQYQLGLAFREGLGVRENQELAKYWFKKASRNRYIDAINILKKFYSKRKLIRQYPSGDFIAMQ
jgi:TPR repeat protein